jgi:hypothetical protein
MDAVIGSNVPFFPAYTAALSASSTAITNISTFDSHFRPSYAQSYNLNLEHQFTSSVIWQLGYVGTEGTHLLGMFGINESRF